MRATRGGRSQIRNGTLIAICARRAAVGLAPIVVLKFGNSTRVAPIEVPKFETSNAASRDLKSALVLRMSQLRISVIQKCRDWGHTVEKRL